MTIVEFRPREGEQDKPVRKRLGNAPTCRHANSEVDPYARTVTCAKCGVPLDPIEVIAKLAAYWAHEKAQQVQVESAEQELHWFFQQAFAKQSITIRRSGVVARLSYQGRVLERTSTAGSIEGAEPIIAGQIKNAIRSLIREFELHAKSADAP